MGKSDDDERATRPYQTIRRPLGKADAPKRRTKVQVRAAEDAAFGPPGLRKEAEPKRQRGSGRARRPPTSPVERPADAAQLSQLLRRTPIEILFEQRQLGEAWVLDDKARLHVFDGERFIDDFWSTTSAKQREELLDAVLAAGGGEPASLRRTLWQTDADLFVELELLGSQLFVNRGQRDGALHVEQLDCDGLGAARKVMQRLGHAYSNFIDVGHKIPLLRKRRREQGGHGQLPLIRSFRRPVRGATREAVVAIAGCRLYCESELASYADRVDAAGVIELPSPKLCEAALEQWIADHRRERYYLATLSYDSKRFAG